MIIKYKKGKEGRSRIRIFFLRGGGERLGLVVEEEDERLGLALVMSVYDYTSSSVHTEARGPTPRPSCPRCVPSALVWGRSVWSPYGLGVRREDGSAVGAGR
jgi:hypothetical protein